MNLKNYISIFFISFLVSCNGNAPINTQVQLSDGIIEGSQEGTLKKYLGIPYAAPPVNDLRWTPPVNVNSWEGILDTKKYSKICYQPHQPTEFYDDGYDLSAMDEDCLYLNVWTRAKNTSDNLPVMVWIHGGALVWGSGGEEYTGKELTKKDIVLVTINYRLGPLGFFAHPELSKENQGSSGNQGYRDQVAALKWVQENIREFGGNPDNVTIFGESAGSWSVNVMQATPLSKGLFHKAIGQSGARLIPLTYLKQNTPYSDSAENLGLSLAKNISGMANPSLGDLRKLDAAEIIYNLKNDPLYLTNFDALTVIDGEVIPKDISKIFLEGAQANVPVLLGSTADEATTFAPSILNPSSATLLKYVDLTPASIVEVLPNVSERIYDLYPAQNEKEAKSSWIDFTTDAMFTAPMQKWAQLMSSVDSLVYLYLWDWYPSVSGSKDLKAFHAAEVPYVFGDFDMFNIDVSEEDLIFSQLMMDMWTNFAKTGNPVPEGDFNWPNYTKGSQDYLILGKTIENRKGLREEKVKLINEAYEKSRIIISN
jgi:para-nitrobenzyl esterase